MRHPKTMSRSERRSTAAEMRKQASAWPERLEPVPALAWPPRSLDPYPIALWRSRYYLVQVFALEPYNGVEARRLSVNRVTIATTGHYEENIPWDDLQRCKRESGHGDWYGVEIYPRDRDIVRVANMRHVWLFAEPLTIGWFS
jgi:hypothetical protein